MRIASTLFILFVFIVPLHAQDTTWYRQKSARMFGNHYAFVRVHAADKQGIYFQQIHTDDMQSWMAMGRFKERKRKIVMHPLPPLKDSVFHYAGHVKDTTVICWMNYLGQAFSVFQLPDIDAASRQLDTLELPLTIWTRARVANTKLVNDSITMHAVMSGKTIRIKLTPGDSVVVFSAVVSHNENSAINRKTHVLRKTKNGLMGETIWDKKKRGLFVRMGEK